MPETNITLKITTPNEMTIAKALQLLTDAFRYQENIRTADGIIPNPENRQTFAKRMIAEQVKKTILRQERIEKIKLIPTSNIQVE
jgi:hypothetical protein